MWLLWFCIGLLLGFLFVGVLIPYLKGWSHRFYMRIVNPPKKLEKISKPAEIPVKTKSIEPKNRGGKPQFESEADFLEWRKQNGIKDYKEKAKR